jgi:hypothetical protein
MTFLLFAGPSPSLANRFGLRRSHPSPIEKTNPQSVSFSLNGTQLRLAKLHVTHSKDETGPASGFRSLGNSFILNNMAERVGFYTLRHLQVTVKPYSSAIIPCVCATYKRIRSEAGVPIVPLIGRISKDKRYQWYHCGTGVVPAHPLQAPGQRTRLG